jgi:hypothetical protein
LVGASANLGWLLGDASPADLSPETRKAIVAELNARHGAIAGE